MVTQSPTTEVPGSPTKTLSFSQPEGVAGRPLQICEIDFEDNVVKCVSENLEQVQKNLSTLASQLKLPLSELKVSVISVMGMYRTGKSFLLDLLMRYLRTQGSISDFEPAREWRMSENSYPVSAFNWLIGEHCTKGAAAANQAQSAAPNGKGKDLDKVRISEGQNHDNERGFHWRSGIEKCTKGIWLWSKPFYIESENLAVLVMDTQGAWDSQMSSEHSACIFGITSLLSSKLIYNLQSRISEEKIDNLDYFTTFANLVVQEARENKLFLQLEEGRKTNPNLTEDDLTEEFDEDDGLGDLHFLVRDWEYFEDGWTLEQCTQQVTDHLMTHLDPGAVVVEERRETVDRLHNLFRSVNLCCLPHPGKQIPKKDWRGAVTDVDVDFLYLLTHFMANLSHGEHPLKVTSPLGQELCAGNFTKIVTELVYAFQSAKPNAVSLRQAFCNCETWRAKEDAVKGFDKEIDERLGGAVLREPEEVVEIVEEVKKRHMGMFDNRIKALFPGTGEEAKKEMMDAVLSHIQTKSALISSRNASLYNQTALKLVAGPTLVLPAAAVAWSLPHILLYAGIAGGGIAHLNSKSGGKGPEAFLDPEVIERVLGDLKSFGENRYADVSGMQVILKDGPEKLPEKLMKAVGGSADMLGGMGGIIASKVSSGLGGGNEEAVADKV